VRVVSARDPKPEKFFEEFHGIFPFAPRTPGVGLVAFE
jgi:hypothetical protein